MMRRPPRSTLFPYTTLFRSVVGLAARAFVQFLQPWPHLRILPLRLGREHDGAAAAEIDELVDQDRKSTRLNSSHVEISYAVFCLKKKKKNIDVSKNLTMHYH